MATTTQSSTRATAKEMPRETSFMRNEFPAIKKACIVLLMCTVVAAGLVSGSQYLLEQQQVSVVQAQMQQNKTRDKRRQVESEKRDMQDFQPKYLQLIDHGFVGPEQRLSWVENIQRIQSAAELLPISYAIAEQQKIQLDSARDTGSLELRGSKMELKMRLLHEMDLLVFLDKLKSGQYFDLQSCSIKRLQDYNPYKLDELLDAECTLYWITLDKRDGATSPVSPG